MVLQPCPGRAGIGGQKPVPRHEDVRLEGLDRWSGSQKLLVTALEPLCVRSSVRVARDEDPVAVQCLDAVHEGRSVFLVQQVVANLDDVVGSDADEVTVEGRVVQLAQRQPVPDGRFASGFGVGHDVRGVEEFGVPEAAEGALSPVRVENPLAETSLMEAMPYGSGDVLAPTAAAVVVDEAGFAPLIDRVLPVVHLYRERERTPDRRRRRIPAIRPDTGPASARSSR